MHRYGVNHPEVDKAFEEFSQNLNSLADLASRHYRDVRIHLFSDHGMADVHVCSDLLPRWNRLGLRYGKDYIAVWDSTMARFWFLNEATRATATSWLNDQKDGVLLTDDQLKAYGCLFPDRK